MKRMSRTNGVLWIAGVTGVAILGVSGGSMSVTSAAMMWTIWAGAAALSTKW